MDHQGHEPARFWYYYDFSPLRPGRYYCGDCFQLLPAIESGTVDMVLIDPPYYMGKDKAWDCFEGRADYMAFMGRAFIQAQRILKENGTLGFWHNDLQKITWLCDWLERNTDMRFATWGIWVKPNHRRKIWVNPGPGNTLRSWFNIGEFCVFFVKGTAGTAWNKTGLELAKLNTENFGSLRDYFRRLLEYTDVTKRQIIETVGQSADHCFRFGSTQWLLPTRETYLKIVAAFHCDSWEGYRTFESLEAERNNAMASYADQIQEANAARFVHNLDANHCNIWISQEAQSGQKHHPCQKPVDITERIIRTHTNPGGLVVDFFAGSGSTGVAAIRAGRSFILIDNDEPHRAEGAAWIEKERQKALCI